MTGQIVKVVETVNGQIEAGTEWTVAREMGNGMYQIVRLGKRGKPLSWVFNPENVAYMQPSDMSELEQNGFITVQ